MLNDIEDGKDGVDFVLVFKLSRFGRNAADLLRMDIGWKMGNLLLRRMKWKLFK